MMASIRKDFLHQLSYRITAGARTILVDSPVPPVLAEAMGTQGVRPGHWRVSASTGIPGSLARWPDGQRRRASPFKPTLPPVRSLGRQLTLDLRTWLCQGCGSLL